MPAQTLASLKNSFGAAKSVRFEDITEDYPVLIVENAHAIAKIALHGAHVMEWAPKDKSPVLYLSPDAIYKKGKAIRGGIPICAPWFNAHPSDESKPAHGFMRNRFWELSDISEREEATTVIFTLEHSEETLALWPHEFTARLTVTVAETLSVSLQITNDSQKECVFGGALHTYLDVEDVREMKVDDFDGCSYLNTVGDRVVEVQKGKVNFDQEVDRIYRSDNAIHLKSMSYEKSIVVSKEGSQSTVLWNPWVDKCRKMSDLPDDAYLNFVCIEAANADLDLISIAPGKTHTLSTNLRIQ